MADDVQSAIIPHQFEISMIRCQPPILDRDNRNAALPHEKSPRCFFPAIAGITLNPDVHRLPAGHDDSRIVLALRFLLFGLHFLKLLDEPGHFRFHRLGKSGDGFGQVVGRQLGLQWNWPWGVMTWV